MTSSSDGLLVSTTGGAVRGAATADARVFLAIPYAAPPVGRRRFEAPHPHEPWAGVRDATRLGPTAPQPPRSRLGSLDLSPFFGTGWEQGDDYLTVNVWAPLAVEHPAPVMMFVHGGAFLAGSTRGPAYDGAAFARDGVVFLAVNYRLGIPGFLHVPDAADNRGRLDVVAALLWVHDNITAFGGDPDNVTLAGQSAGAIVVSSIVASTDARGTFRRAIIQSGSGTAAFTPAQATMVTEETGRLLRVEPTVDTLADIPDHRFVELGAQLAVINLSTPDNPDPLGGITPFSLVLDRQPADAIAGGLGADVDVLIGSNSDESALYLAPLLDLDMTTSDDVRATAARFHPAPDRLVAAYRADRRTDNPAELRVAILSDGMFGVGTRRFADAHARCGAETHLYEFTWRSDALGGSLGSSHLIELPFVFDRAALPEFHGPRALLGSTPSPPDLAARTHAAWVSYAMNGNPGWPTYRPEHPVLQRMGDRWSRVEAPHATVFEAWSTTQ